MFQIDRRRYDAFLQGFHEGDGLHAAGCAQHMSGHRLVRRYRNAIRLLAKHLLNGRCLRTVTDDRACGMGADDIHVGWGEVRLGQASFIARAAPLPSSGVATI